LLPNPGLALAALVALSGGLPALEGPGSNPEPRTLTCPFEVPWVLSSVRDAGFDALRRAQIVGALDGVPLPTRGGRVSTLTPCAGTAGAPLGLESLHLGSLHPGSLHLGPLRVAATPLELSFGRNRTAPLEGRLDGPRWNGRGDVAEATLGVQLHIGPLSLAIAPVVTWNENLSFNHPENPLPRFSPFAHAGHVGTIDLPRRRGDTTFVEVFPGESELRFEVGPLHAGLSTRNLHWGPARRNPLVLGPGGPGFAHAFVGTATPVVVGGVGVTFEAIRGRLEESSWFDRDPENDHRTLDGARLSLNWDRVPGLELGLLHTRVSPEMTMPPDSLAHLAHLEMGSLVARWLIPSARTELYAEWGRENLVSGWLGRAPSVEGANAFTLGAEHLYPTSRGWLQLYVELTSLRAAQALLAGGTAPSLYTHSRVTQGYTHRGDLLGAPIGPGSDAQTLGVQWMEGWGSVGFMIERLRYDDETYARQWAEWYNYQGHDTELRGSIPVTLRRSMGRLGTAELEGELIRGMRWNRHFTGFDRLGQQTFSEWNTSVHLGLRWRP
jgi:hypothetical protein